MGTYESCVTSCSIIAWGKIGANASGPTGAIVAELSGGSSWKGRSGTRLYQLSGISFSSRRYLVYCMRISTFCGRQLSAFSLQLFAVPGVSRKPARATMLLSFARISSLNLHGYPLLRRRVRAGEGLRQSLNVRLQGVEVAADGLRVLAFFENREAIAARGEEAVDRDPVRCRAVYLGAFVRGEGGYALALWKRSVVGALQAAYLEDALSVRGLIR